MATLFQTLQFFDDGGAELSNGRLYWSIAGTSTPKQTWQDEAEAIPHALAYITLDGHGRPPGGGIFIRGSYKLIVKDSAGNTVQTIDYINEYDQYDFTGLTATIADLNSTHCVTAAKNTNYTVLLTDRNKTILVDASSATTSYTISLPTSVSVGNTFRIVIKKTDASIKYVIVLPNGIETIDNSARFVLYDKDDFVELHSDGSNWYVISSRIRGTILTYAATPVTVETYHNNYMFNFNAAALDITVNLPACATVGRGFCLYFKKIDTSTHEIYLTPNGSETIDGSSNYVLQGINQFVALKTDGVNWFIIAETADVDNFHTGDVKITYNNIQPGWVKMNDTTIGDASSGATERANADCHDLFVMLWNAVLDTWCPVFLGAVPGRGASAEADWLAHKKLTIPQALGRSFIQTGTATGVTSPHTFALGENYGEYKHTQTVPEIAAHTHTLPHPYRPRTDTPDGGGLTYVGGGYTVEPLTINNTGSSTPMNIVHPVCAGYYYIKL